MGKKRCRKMLSLLLAASMVASMIPTTAVQAKQSDKELEDKLRNAVSDEEYPNGVISFGQTQLSVTEGEKQTITVVRQGNTDKEASVTFKAVDVSASYGSDYLLTVVHSKHKKEQLDAVENAATLMEESAQVGGDNDVSVLVSESEEVEETATTEKKVIAKELSSAKKSGLSATYKLQNNNEEAPQHDWKETNPEDVSEDIKSAMDEGSDSAKEYLKQVNGVSTTITFAPGEYQKEIVFTSLDDEKAESEEQMVFALYNANGTEIGANYNGYVNIKDNEEAQKNVFAVKDKKVTVSNEEEVAKVTIERKSGIDQMAFVTVGTKAVTAVANEDYEAVTQELLFPAGVESKTIEIPIIGERTEERSFYVGISENGVVREEGNYATLVTIAKYDAEASDETEGISAKATKESIKVTNGNWIGRGGAYVTNKFDLTLADKITIKYMVTGNCNKKECKKTYTYRDKRVRIKVVNDKNQTILSDVDEIVERDFASGLSVSFSHNFEDGNDFYSWDSLSQARVWVSAEGFNRNDNANIAVTSIEVSYPGFTFQVNNNSAYSYYTEQQYSSSSNKTSKEKILLGYGHFGNSTEKDSTILSKSAQLGLKKTFSNIKNSQGVSANGNTVDFKGYRLVLPNASGKYSEIISGLDSKKIDKKFLNSYKKYMYDGRRFVIVPVFEVKSAKVTFNNDAATVNRTRNKKGNFKGFEAGKTISVKKLDTFAISGYANTGFAINSIQVKGNWYSASNQKVDGEKTSFTCGLGSNNITSYTAYLYYDAASIKVMADPKFKNTSGIKKGKVIYVDEKNNVSTGDYSKAITISNILMNHTYNIIGISENGYRPTWRDGTLDYNEDGETENISNSYTPFTPVKGNVLPYVTKLATGRIYYNFEKQQEIGQATDIYGYVKIRDRLILTGQSTEKGVNGANVTIDGIQVQTKSGGTNKNNQNDGFFRVTSKTFSVSDYYLANVNAYGEEGSINTAFVMNPGMIKECVINAEEDLTISNATVYVKNSKGNYVSQTITKDEDGYYSVLTNGDKDYRLEMKADKSGVVISSAELQFYDADGKKLSATVAGKETGSKNSGYFQFDFNPASLSLPVGTTLRVMFTDNQKHTYLQREVGMYLSQSIGNIDIANGFGFGSANTLVKLIGKVDSSFNMGWSGDFDDTESENILNDAPENEKVISVGFNVEALDKPARSAIKKAAEELAEADEAIGNASKELSIKSEELAKKKTLTDADKKSLEELKQKVENAYKEKEDAQKTYDTESSKTRNPQRSSVALVPSVELNYGFSFTMTFGVEDGSYYFKSMELTATIEGGVGATVQYATPIGITINLGFKAGGTGSASFIVEQTGTKKYYISDMLSEESGSISLFDENSVGQYKKYGSFTLKPYITISVGAGVLGDLVSVTVDGTAEFDMQFFTQPDKNKGFVSLSSKLTVKVLCISHSWTIANNNVPLFGNSASSSVGLDNQNYLYEPSDMLEAEDFSYMEGGSKWKSGKISAKSLDENKDAYIETSVADKIAENPDFKMISIGDGKYLAVFTNADTNRESVNAKAIYYTVYDAKNGWSTPVQIEDDGTLDQDPDVFDLGDHGAVITWSTSEKEFTEDTSRVEMQNSMDIHCAFFDKATQKLGTIQAVTKHTSDDAAGTEYDNYSDYCADVAANVSYNDDKMVVYYEKKEYAASQEECLGDVLFPQYSLMAARTYTFEDSNGVAGQWTDTYSEEEMEEMKQILMEDGLAEEIASDRAKAYETCFYGQNMFEFLPSVSIEEELDDMGYWTEEPKVNEVDGYSALIVDTDAMSYNDLGVFAYTVDFDGDLNTCADRDVYMQIYDFVTDSFMHPVVVTSDSVEDQCIQFVRVQNETYLTWLQNGNIVALNMSNIIQNYKTLLKSGTTKAGDSYYYINKSLPSEDSEEAIYEPPVVVVEGEVANQDNAVSAISDFDVESSNDYVYFMWTQMDSELKDGVEEGSYEATDPANAITEKQLYTARYDVTNSIATKPVQVTSAKGANYTDVAFAVEKDNLVGLVYRADSKTLSLDEYNAMVEKNNASAETANGEQVESNEKMDILTETEYVPFSIVDTENAVPYAFRVDPKSSVKIKDAVLDNAVAGQSATLSFEILNDGIDTVSGLTLTIVDEEGNSVLTQNEVETDEDNTEITTESATSVEVDRLYGGYSQDISCQVPIAESAAKKEITITIKDKDGNEVVSQKVSETLECNTTISEFKAEQTEVRNQYKVSGVLENTGETKVEAGSIVIGSSKDDKENEYASVAYPELAVGESTEFEQLITVSPDKEFVSVTDEEGNVVETGNIYAKVGDATAETVIEREADCSEMERIKAIKDITLEGAKDNVVTVSEDMTVLNPVMNSTLTDEENEITGEEGLQYKYVSENEEVATINSNGAVNMLKAGETKVTMYVYPANSVFMADNKSEEDSEYSVLGQEDDAYLTVPESAIYQKEFTLKVTAASVDDTTEAPNADTTTEIPDATTQAPAGTTAGDTTTQAPAGTTASDATTQAPAGTTGDATTQASAGTTSDATTQAPAATKEAKTFAKNDLQYKVISSNAVTVTGTGNANISKVKIPATVKADGKTYKVTSIEAKAFANKKKLKTVVIGKNVTTISKKAFANCGALKTVTISSKKLKTVGKKAFAGIHKKAVFKVSGNAKYKSKVKKLLSSKTGYQKTMKIK